MDFVTDLYARLGDWWALWHHNDAENSNKFIETESKTQKFRAARGLNGISVNLNGISVKKN